MDVFTGCSVIMDSYFGLVTKQLLVTIDLYAITKNIFGVDYLFPSILKYIIFQVSTLFLIVC